MEQTEAILIGRSRYSESTLIIEWCAPGMGLFKTIAKGALRPKSSFAGRLDLFVTAEIRFARSRHGTLHTLTEVQWANPRLPLRSNYGRVLAATYFVKLASQMVERETPIPEIYDLICKALDHLSGRDPSRTLVERFEQRLAEDLGLAGATPGTARLALEEALHRALPVQRRQLLDWIAAQSTSPTPHDDSSPRPES